MITSSSLTRRTMRLLRTVLLAGSSLSITASAQDLPKIGRDSPQLPESPAAAALSAVTAEAARVAAPTVVGVSVPLDEVTLKRWQFWEEFTGRRADDKKKRTRLVSSGVFVTSVGHVVTNHHVIEDVHPDSIRVITNDGTTYSAVVIGSDATTDIAVLRVYGEGFPLPCFAESDSVALGDWVLAIGNPMSLRTTVTAGIVSALSRGTRLRPEDDDRSIQNFLQFDAAVNPGNSGGGLFDTRGCLVGLVSRLWSSSGYFAGYGLAIPSKLVRAVVEDIIVDGVVDRATLGIAASDLSDTAARSLRMRSARGAVVDYVDSTSAAARAGIRKRDVVLSFDGQTVSSASELQVLLAAYRGDGAVPIDVWRNGRTETLRASLTRSRAPGAAATVPAAALGVVAHETTSDEAAREKLDSRRGIVIERVDPYGAASHGGVFTGDVLLSVDSDPVGNPTALQLLLSRRQPGDKVNLLVWRGGEELTLPVILGQAPVGKAR